MKNDIFNPISLRQKKLYTPLFNQAAQAYSGSKWNEKGSRCSEKHIVIYSKIQMQQKLFIEGNICPVYINKNKSYILLQGQSLKQYFLKKKQHDLVLVQQQIWKLINQICKSLLLLRLYGYKHRHIKQYSIRKIPQYGFKLIYHPTMIQVKKVLDDMQNSRVYNNRWKQYYFAPQQLQKQYKQYQNSCVFTLGVLIINIMNPIDFKRSIYNDYDFTINNKILQQKIYNSKRIYSLELVRLVQKMLIMSHYDRIKLQQLVNVSQNYSLDKTSLFSSKYQSLVRSKLSKSKQKNKSSSKQKNQDLTNSNKIVQSQIINFERGTFGGHDQQQYLNLQDSFSIQDQIKKQNFNSPQPTKYKGLKQQQSPVIFQKTIHKYQFDSNKQQQYQTNKKKNKNSNKIEKNYYKQSPIQNLKHTKLQYEKAQQQHINQIQLQVEQLKNKCQYYLKLSQCLAQPYIIATKLGKQGVWINGSIYFGNFINGRRNGLSLEIYLNKQYYYGYFKDDLYHGQGFYYWNQKEHYLGKFQSGQKIQGIWYGKKKYTGSIYQNKRHGIGCCSYPNGRIYEGQWYQGKYHGLGIILQPSGQKFIGVFNNGFKYGAGTLFSQGVRLYGIWRGQKIEGQCQMIFEDGRVYKGQIDEQLQIHGQGQMTFTKGTICRGRFQNDDFVYGQILYKNGQKYVGEVKNYIRKGMGTYYYLDGRKLKGQWRDNVCTKIDQN